MSKNDTSNMLEVNFLPFPFVVIKKMGNRRVVHEQKKNKISREQSRFNMIYLAIVPLLLLTPYIFHKGTPAKYVVAWLIAFVVSGLVELIVRFKKSTFKIAMKWAENGDPYAQYYLGACYYAGAGVDANVMAARICWQKAAENGFAKAMYCLGRLYIESSPEKGAMWFRKAAELGCDDAQYNLGICYLLGAGVQKCGSEALKWLKKVAGKRFAMEKSTARELVDTLEKRGIFAEEKRATAEQGDREALYSLSRLYSSGDWFEKDDAEAVNCLKKSAERGFAPAQVSLGNIYYHGIGVDENKTEAAKWFRQAAEQGDAAGQYELGMIYMATDRTEATKWLREAAEQGHKEAQFYLGVACVDSGNTEEGVKWYRKSAEQGFVLAMVNLGELYYSGEKVAQDYAEAVRWFQMSAAMGISEVQYKLGLCYLNGQGISKSRHKGLKLIRMAAEQGHEKAQKTLTQF